MSETCFTVAPLGSPAVVDIVEPLICPPGDDISIVGRSNLAHFN